MTNKAMLAGAAALVLSACQPGKPPHYYIFCESKDYKGWTLINTESREGYLVACTYQSTDLRQQYTARCGESGCD